MNEGEIVMKKAAAIKKIRNRAKLVDRKVVIEENDYHGNGQIKVYARFEGSNQTISFWTNSDDSISSPHICRDGDVSDSMTDYFAGYHVDNITQALNTVAALPAKYPVGWFASRKTSATSVGSWLARSPWSCRLSPAETTRFSIPARKIATIPSTPSVI